MTQIFNALFGVAANTLLSAYTSESGHTFASWSGAPVPMVYAASGGVLGQVSGGKSYWKVNAAAPSADISIKAQAYVDALAGFVFTGMFVRGSADGMSAYVGGYDRGTAVYQIYRLSSTGAATLLAQSAAMAPTVKTEYSWEFSAVGTTNVVLTFKVNGTTVVSHTDVAPGAAYTGTGFYGPAFNGSVSGAGIWHNSMSADTLSASASALTISGPTAGAVGSASSAFTVGANGPLTSTIVVTPSDGGAGGTFSPASVTLSSGTPTGTFAYTPASSGTKSITLANDGGLANPAAASYAVAGGAATTVMLDGPTGGTVNADSTDFTVYADGVISGTITVTPGDSGAGGVFTPTSVQISASSASATFKYKPTSGGTKTISIANNAGLANDEPIAYSAASSGVFSGAALFDNMLFSPYNWEGHASGRKAWHPGAYFELIFDGPTCALQFDLAGHVSGPIPQIHYQVDGCGPVFTTPISANLNISVPANVANSTRHHLRVDLKFAGGSNCWSTDNGAVILKSATITAGGSIRKPLSPRVKKGIWFGDSITTGDLTVKETNADADAQAGWAVQIARLMNTDYGISSFGSTRWGSVGAGGTGIPGLATSWDLLSAGVPRDFAGCDYVAINMGTNGGAAAADVTTTLNGLLGAVPASCKIILMRPFNGSGAAGIQNGIAACSNPARCTYIDTTGMLNTAFVDTSGLHPLAFENASHITPQLFPHISAAVNGTTAAPVLTQRTVSVTLKLDKDTFAASMNGFSVSFYDESSPGQTAAARYQSNSETTDASGVLTFQCGTTRAPGVGGTIVVSGPAGIHYNGPATVA